MPNAKAVLIHFCWTRNNILLCLKLQHIFFVMNGGWTCKSVGCITKNIAKIQFCRNWKLPKLLLFRWFVGVVLIPKWGERRGLARIGSGRKHDLNIDGAGSGPRSHVGSQIQVLGCGPAITSIMQQQHQHSYNMTCKPNIVSWKTDTLFWRVIPVAC